MDLTCSSYLIYFLLLCVLIPIILRVSFGLTIVGLTGGIASGKTQFAAQLHEHGATLIDFDVLSRDVVLPGSVTLQTIKRVFGNQMVKFNGELDRARLGQLCFSDSSARRRLNGIMRIPLFLLFVKRLLQCFFIFRRMVVVVDAPLLFESGLHYLCSHIVCVNVPLDVQIQRLRDRDGLDQEAAVQRINSQMPLATKCQRSHFVIENNGTIDQLHQKASDWWQQHILPFYSYRHGSWRFFIPTRICMFLGIFCSVPFYFLYRFWQCRSSLPSDHKLLTELVA
eukprot:TRINITY_DN8947_c0_g1_i1.p1 TRINITY_DN8947_c0_g1~~TRINITY_DN8947_c0_g1_i1.p1  ORF type:complete len:282 (+),score=27.13 TRINITY_DN8947_c0_g1_i1:27-872(+)